MRYSMLLGVLAAVGAVACGDQMQALRDARNAQVHQLGEDQGQQDQSQATGNPNITTCEDLATRAEGLALVIGEIYEKAKLGGDVTADLKVAFTDASDLAGDIDPCIGRSPTAPAQGDDEGQQEQQDQQDQQGQQEQQAAQGK